MTPVYRRYRIEGPLDVCRASAFLFAMLPAGLAVAQSGTRVDSPPEDRVSYSTFAPASLDIYLFEGMGRTPRRLIDHPALDYDATVSPDGHWLIFCSERRGNPDLYVLDLEQETSQPQLLIDSDALED